jgi:hypothetical protein
MRDPSDETDETGEIEALGAVAHGDSARRSAAHVCVRAATTSELTSAFHSAQHDGACREPQVALLPSSDDCSQLRGAIHAFVAVGRSSGAPPERVLADLKRATRPTYVEDDDGLHGERLQTLVIREFLASYYAIAVSAAEPSPESTE